MQRRLLALPVVDEQNRLTGVFDVPWFTETLIDVERREAADEVFQLVGVQVEQEKNKTLGRLIRNRLPWLLCNVVSGLAAALIAESYAPALRTVVELAFFVPLVLTIAESIAMQSVTMTMLDVQVSRHAGAAPRRMLREMGVGMALGVSSGTIVGGLGIAWLRFPMLSAVVAGAIVLSGAVGAALGYFIPRLVHHWKLDPKIASGPAVLALTDVAAVTAYFSLAAAVLLP
jgi:magnesium transporter